MNWKVYFVISVKSIVKFMGLALASVSFPKKPKGNYKDNFDHLFLPGEGLYKLQSGYNREDIHIILKHMALLVMKYVTLVDRKRRFYTHMFSILNLQYEVRNNFPLWIMSSLSQFVCKAIEKGKPPLHQGLIQRVYNFHLALSPSGWVPSIVDVSVYDPNLIVDLIVTPSNFGE